MTTYNKLIAEIKNTTLTKGKLKTLITKCSQVIDDLGCKRMALLEKSFDADDSELRKQQQHLIRIRDYLFKTYTDLQSMPRDVNKINMSAMEGISTYHVEDTPDEIGSWSC